MKKALATFTALVLMPASQTMAWTGGPFSNNSALPTGDDGVYEAVATTSNGMGIYRFGVNNGSDPTATGTAVTGSNITFTAGITNATSSNVWYYKGVTYYGPAFGTVNSDAGIVSCIGNAQSNAPLGNAVQGRAGGSTASNTTVNGVNVVGPVGNNISFANSHFIAKIMTEKAAPTVRFQGAGEVSFIGEATIVADVEAINPITIEPGGVFEAVIEPGGAGTFTSPGRLNTTTGSTVASTEVSPGGGTTDFSDSTFSSTISFSSNTSVSTGGEDSAFPQRGHVRSFVVFGSRVSTSFTAAGTAAAAP